MSPTCVSTFALILVKRVRSLDLSWKPCPWTTSNITTTCHIVATDMHCPLFLKRAFCKCRCQCFDRTLRFWSTNLRVVIWNKSIVTSWFQKYPGIEDVLVQMSSVSSALFYFSWRREKIRQVFWKWKNFIGTEVSNIFWILNYILLIAKIIQKS